MKSIIYQIALFILITFKSNSQTPYSTWEAGFYGGECYYLGELNETHFLPFNISFGPRVRYNYDQRLGLKLALTYGEISGDDAKSNNSFKRDRNFSFKSQLFEASFVGEFNFIPYSVLDKKASLGTPFLFLGLGYTRHNPKTQFNGNWVNTNELKTEGVNFNKNIFSLPIGIGYKMRAKKFGFEFSWGIRKSNSDYLDDVSTNFANNSFENTLSNETNNTDTTEYENVSNIKRGDQYNKDWYVFTGLTILINLTPEEVCRKI